MMDIRSFIVLAIIGLCGTSCSEVIDLNTGTSKERIVIFGGINDGIRGHLVEISRTSTLDGSPSPLDNAIVRLIGDNGEIGTYSGTEPGKYVLSIEEQVVFPGGTYHLYVELPDGGVYESVPALMPSASATDVLSFTAGTRTSYTRNGTPLLLNEVELLVETQFPANEPAGIFRWEVYETYFFPERPIVLPFPPPVPPWCYITNNITGQQILIEDGTILSDGVVVPSRPFVAREVDNAFFGRYYFQVVRFSITRESYNYWSQLDAIANINGSIFDRPPGVVKGNFFNVEDSEEEVLGYFEIAKVDTTRMLITSRDIPFTLRNPCSVLDPPTDICSNCLLIENSVKEKPHFVN